MTPERAASIVMEAVEAWSEPLPPPAVAEDDAATTLTPRVHQVALLVADGLQDREIAARLHLSSRTIHRHVATALRVTGARNRVELTRLVDAGRRGL